MESTNGNGAEQFSYASTIDIDELDRQMERGSLFTQATLQRGFARIESTEMLLAAVIRALTTKGVVSEDDIGVILEDDARDEDEVDDEETPRALASATHPAVVKPASGQPSGISWPAISIRVDQPDAKDEPDIEVDCSARMHVCHAICCSLKFPLSAPEIDGGKVKWDIGHPYVIRHDAAGMCVHNNSETGFCGVYEDRPKICRRYSCVNDRRIWKDFDNMVLNQEWIDENLGVNDIHVSAVVPVMDETEVWTPGEIAGSAVAGDFS